MHCLYPCWYVLVYLDMPTYSPPPQPTLPSELLDKQTNKQTNIPFKKELLDLSFVFLQTKQPTCLQEIHCSRPLGTHMNWLSLSKHKHPCVMHCSCYATWWRSWSNDGLLPSHILQGCHSGWKDWKGWEGWKKIHIFTMLAGKAGKYTFFISSFK